MFWNQYLEKLNPTCTFDRDHAKWVMYFTEKPKCDRLRRRAGGGIALTHAMACSVT